MQSRERPFFVFGIVFLNMVWVDMQTHKMAFLIRRVESRAQLYKGHCQELYSIFHVEASSDSNDTTESTAQ